MKKVVRLPEQFSWRFTVHQQERINFLAAYESRLSGDPIGIADMKIVALLVQALMEADADIIILKNRVEDMAPTPLERASMHD